MRDRKTLSAVRPRIASGEQLHAERVHDSPWSRLQPRRVQQVQPHPRAGPAAWHRWQRAQAARNAFGHRQLQETWSRRELARRAR